ncbi:peptidase S24 [Cellulophaga baltica]|uniref:S24 family peptidase n=1 Tax=Cellulophaga TaxID=104264 RepID=UPI001C067750|nr:MULTISPECIES: S24 family peptidase [Cellulophaga]MBU2996088.1 peptidase S24 [Cellulophaga baltica]MDO6767483.1 S24 family peptidase [Cellulophaga sp. 1_MG-2023]
MDIFSHGKLKRVEKKHAFEVSKQVGFPSPATHYLEPSISLDQELIGNSDATFYVRIEGDALSEFNILENDVLIIDRSLAVKENDLAMVVTDGEFKVIRVASKEHQNEFALWGVIKYIIHACK